MAGVIGMVRVVGVVGLWGWQGGGQLGLDVLWVLQLYNKNINFAQKSAT